MPRASFLQTVLRKPTRSYADPSGASPWAQDDYYDERDSVSGLGSGSGSALGSYSHRHRSGRSGPDRDPDVSEDGYRYASGYGFGYSAGPSSGYAYDHRDAGQGRATGSDLGPVNDGYYRADDWARDGRSGALGSQRRPKKAQSIATLPKVERVEREQPREEYEDALPRREEHLATRFPRAAKKSSSSVVLRETERGMAVADEREGREGAMTPIEGGTVRRKKKRAVGGPGAEDARSMVSVEPSAGPSRSTSVHEVAKSRTRPTEPLPLATQPAAPRPPTSIARKPSAKRPINTASTFVAPPIEPPVIPRPQLVAQPKLPSPTLSLATPPGSDRSSSARSSRDQMPETPPDPKPAILVAPVRSPQKASPSPRVQITRAASGRSARSRMSIESDSGETVFFTPPSSPPGAMERHREEVVREEEEETVAEPLVTPINENPVPPTFNIQPPTPAPDPDPVESVFGTPTTPTPPKTPAEHLPLEAQAAVPAATLALRLLQRRPSLPSNGSTSSAPPIMTGRPVEDDAQSDHAQPPSDDEGGAFLAPSDVPAPIPSGSMRPPSRPPSVTHSAPLPSRPSRETRSNTSRRSSRVSPNGGGSHSSYGSQGPSQALSQRRQDDSRRGSMQMAELAARRPSREGSIRSSVSGFGKGGWAAAAAASQSGRSSPAPTPVMYMPTGSGWEAFHAQQGGSGNAPPPRQSRYTPLPAASQPMNFDRLLGAEGSGSAMGSRTPSAEPSEASGGQSRDRGGSEALGHPVQLSGVDAALVAASEPSQYSDEESESSESEIEGERPSRSYASGWTGEVERDIALSDASASPALPEMAAVQTSPAPPPIPRRDPRRLSVTQPESPASQASPTMTHLAAYPTSADSESQYTYGSEADAGMYEEQYGVSPGSASPASYPSRPLSPVDMPSRPLSPSSSIREFPRPSFLDPDVITVLPEMSVEDSNNLYRSPTPSEAGGRNRASWRGIGSGAGSSASASASGVGGGNPYIDRPTTPAGSVRRSSSVLGSVIGKPMSILAPPRGLGRKERSEAGESKAPAKRAQSALGHREEKKSVHWEGSSYGEGVLMESNGREPERMGGYTTLVLPSGAYTPVDPQRKRSSLLDHRALGMPSTSMAALTLSLAASKLPLTPVHLRANLPLPVDFCSHLAPPSKVGSAQVLVQVYAVGLDRADVRALEEKGKGEVGKWVPGRSFVGRVVNVGKDEREMVKGELVVGLVDVRKSGALTEYIVVDRRRLARAPHPTTLTLEQLALLPLHGVPAARTLALHATSSTTSPTTGRPAQLRALVHNAHTGIAALLCQDLARRGAHVTALIPGGEGSHSAQTRCMAHGARGVLTGAPAAVMFGLDDGGWDVVVDAHGGERVYEAAKRLLKNGGRYVSLVKATPDLPLSAQVASKPSGFKTLRAAFSGGGGGGSSKRKGGADAKEVRFEYVHPAGTGEPEVDVSGLDVRDVLEEGAMLAYRPAVEAVWRFEEGMRAFGVEEGGTGVEVGVVRLIN